MTEYPQRPCGCDHGGLHGHFEAVQDGLPVGHLFIVPRQLPYGQETIGRRYAEILELEVDPLLRGFGIGTALVAEALEWARARGFTHVAVEASARDDSIGRTFYPSNGLGFIARSLIYDVEL